jgi:hypothetical protein
MKIDLAKLASKYPALYTRACAASGKSQGIVDVPLADFTDGNIKYLSECREPEPQISMAELEKEQQAEMQRAADQQHAINRLTEYATSAGLEDTDANFAIIRDWVVGNAKGYWSAPAVDAAISHTRNRLTWKAAPAPPEPARIGGKGPAKDELQLPLDASEFQMKRASVAQLQDLIARRRKVSRQQFIRHAGSFGSKFI